MHKLPKLFGKKYQLGDMEKFGSAQVCSANPYVPPLPHPIILPNHPIHSPTKLHNSTPSSHSPTPQHHLTSNPIPSLPPSLPLQPTHTHTHTHTHTGGDYIKTYRPHPYYTPPYYIICHYYITNTILLYLYSISKPFNLPCMI